MKYGKSSKLFFGIIFSMMFFVLFAQDKKSDESKKSDDPIGLVADKGFYDQEKGLAIYEGNVVVTQEEMIIWTDKLTIILTNGDATHIEAETIGGGKLSKFEFKSKDKDKKELIKGRSRRIDYEVAKKLVTLTTDAVVTQGDDKVIGDKLTYNLNNANIGGSRIKMTFNPSQK